MTHPLRGLTAPLADRAFAGFPRSGEATVIPRVFFSRVLPEIDDPAELVVTLYVFFQQGLRKRRPPYISERELASDPALMRSLRRLCGEEDGSLERGLALAVQRRTLMRAKVRSQETGEAEWLYLVNNPANREAVERLAAQGAPLGGYLPPAPEDGAANIFELYEQNIGPVTPLIEADLREAEQRYPPALVREAFREAAELNRRSWRYIERILQRWETEGRTVEKLERDPEADWLAQRYREGKRRRPYSAAP